MAEHTPPPAKASLQLSLGICMGVALSLGAYHYLHRPAKALSAGEFMPTVGFKKMKAEDIPISISAIGQSLGPRYVNVQAQVSGPLVEHRYLEGSSVKAGDVLMQIDPLPFELALRSALAQHRQAEAQWKLAHKEHQRQLDLFKRQATSQDTVDQANQQEAVALAQMQIAEVGVQESGLNLSYATIRAPIDGVTTLAPVSVGNLIQSGSNGTLLTTVTQTQPIWVNFALSEEDLKTLPKSSLKAENIQAIEWVNVAGEALDSDGQLSYLSSQLDPNLASLALRAEFDNRDGALKPGQFVRIKLKVHRGYPIFSVPQASVLQDDQGHFVYVKNSDDRLETRRIEALEWQGSDWLIGGGLKDDDIVITDNLLKLRPGMKVIPQAAKEPQSSVH